MTTQVLSGRRVVVTGSTRGLGWAFAWTLADGTAAFHAGGLSLEPLHPDKIGRTVRERLAAVPPPHTN